MTNLIEILYFGYGSQHIIFTSQIIYILSAFTLILLYNIGTAIRVFSHVSI